MICIVLHESNCRCLSECFCYTFWLHGVTWQLPAASHLLCYTFWNTTQVIWQCQLTHMSISITLSEYSAGILAVSVHVHTVVTLSEYTPGNLTMSVDTHVRYTWHVLHSTPGNVTMSVDTCLLHFLNTVQVFWQCLFIYTLSCYTFWIHPR